MRVVAVASVLLAVGLATPSSQSVPHDAGAAGAWHRIQKLRTTASVMHTTAHPDDEHGGVITRLSRKDGARVALLTLNRGESGDNAIGPQLFDGLGLIRTEELAVSDLYYGVDDQYFTTVIDYGFSKRLEEAFEKWGREQVLRDVVRIIRADRPWVLLSRFQGNERDGHGNHQTAGLITQLAFKAAGDPAQYPEQIKEGLRPWQPFKVYIGGVRENEAWNVRMDSGEYSPWLGDSYDNIARYGLSFQRSQNAGRFNPSAGPNFGYYTRVASRVRASDKEASIFEGLDTTYQGLFKTLEREPPAGVADALAGLDQAVAKAAQTFVLTDPSAAVPALVEGLRLTREVIAKIPSEGEALFVLRVKERQFQDAINSALGLELVPRAQPAGVPDATGPFSAFAPPPSMPAPVAGQAFEVRVRLANRGGVPITLGAAADSAGAEAPALRTPATPHVQRAEGLTSAIWLDGAPGWSAASADGESQSAPDTGTPLDAHETITRRFTVTLADNVPISTRPYFHRRNILESRYTLSDPTQFGRPASAPPLIAVARYSIGGQTVEVRESVKRREPKLPYGDVLREVRSVPRIALSTSPSTAIVPLTSKGAGLELQLDILHNADAPTNGAVALDMPPGWTAEPRERPFAFARAGERATYRFTVRPGAIDATTYQVEAVARAAGQEYREGYEVIDQRDLEVRYLYRPSTVEVKGLDVNVLPNMKVGYVMGVGDQVPLGLQQLGVQVTLLGDRELATMDLSQFDAVITGTRAYAVREDLKTYNQRLLDYVARGGNMIVLYNTQELVPSKYAPFAAELPRNAEEVSEEDSPVEILAPTHQVFTWPNKIAGTDFRGWVEQRGSKFFTTWDPAYTPMVATFDKGQAPQRGGWLIAKHGKGTWTYFAYALHRQLPYGVAGAYRITANLLALGKMPDR